MIREHLFYEVIPIDYSNIKEYPEINTYMKSCNNIWITSDLHLFSHKGEKNKTTLIEKHLMENINEGDLLIILGDLVDDEFTDTELLKQFFLKIKGKKILVLGNNDLFDDSFYYECGFNSVVPSFKYGDKIFTHYPVEVENDIINIHGHIHFSRTYYNVSCDNHIDAFCGGHDFKPLKIEDILELFNKGYYKGVTYRNR